MGRLCRPPLAWLLFLVLDDWSVFFNKIENYKEKLNQGKKLSIFGQCAMKQLWTHEDFKGATLNIDHFAAGGDFPSLLPLVWPQKRPLMHPSTAFFKTDRMCPGQNTQPALQSLDFF